MRYLILITFLFMSNQITFAADGSHTPEQVLEERNALLEEALTIRSFEKIFPLYGNDVVIVPPDAPMMTAMEDIKAYWHGMLESPVAKVAIETPRIDQYRPDLFMEHQKYEVFDAEGNSLGTGFGFVTWQLIDNQWKIIRDIWN